MRLSGWRNELLRALVRPGMHILGWLSVRQMRGRIREDEQVRAALRARLQVGVDTPIRLYDSVLREHVHAAVEREPQAAIVRTSGSTSEPKELLYTPRRLRKLKKAFALATARIVRALRVRRPIIFTLASTKEDDSLTSLYAWQHGRVPARLDCLVTPHMILSHPELRMQTERFGLTAVRLWAVVLSNPGWLYSTNPSTQSLFLRQLETDWEGARALCRAWVSGELDRPLLRTLVGRIVASGWENRMQAVLSAAGPWPVHAWWPGLEIRSSWDGGSVGCFLSDISRVLPDSVRFMPMFSMSTESIETLPFFERSHPRFLPVAPGVLAEFLPEESLDDPAHLVEPAKLQKGSLYSLVLSDSYGLSRYQTEDVFECVGHIGGVPDLVFRRRRGLAWSFTGEKLTGAQLEVVFNQLRQESDIGGDVALCGIPTEPGESGLPGYVLAIVHMGDAPDLPSDFSMRFDFLLGQINPEYADKRESGRLAPPRFEAIVYDGLAAALDPRAQEEDGNSQRAWDSQFKLLPLLRQTWETLNLSR